MSDRLDRIYTRSGDKGTTALANGRRIAKTHPRVHALGEVDELNCLIGILTSELDPEDPLAPWLLRIQNDLFDIGGELAVADPGYSVITLDIVTELELWLDQLNQHLPPLKEFILPGGSRSAAQAHLARAVCRRSERCLVDLTSHEAETVNPLTVAYLNRLSDLLFVMARTLSHRQGGREILWKPRQPA